MRSAAFAALAGALGVSAFEKFLHDRIKVEGRVGNLGEKVVISQSGDGKIEVVAHIPFSGRYLKYL